MPETKLEAKDHQVIGLDAEIRTDGLKKEAIKAAEKPVIHQEADLGYYSATLGPTLGKAVFEVVAGRNRSRVKAFENRDFQIWFEKVFNYVEKRAAEMGYFTTDVEFSHDSGITRSGTLLLRLVPKTEARRLI